MSEKRRHRTGGGAKKIAAWGFAILLVALLSANLVMALVNEKDETPQGFVTPELLQTAAFWAPVGATLVMSILGLYWSSRAYSQTERTSLVWARGGYAFALAGTSLFVFLCFDGDSVDGRFVPTLSRQWVAALASFLLAGQTAVFAMVSFKELRRAETGEGSRRPRGHRERTDTPPGEPAAAPDTAQ